MAQLYKPYKPKSSGRKAQDNTLFSGIWIRWQALTVGERFVCANIILVPVWWFLGLYGYMPLLLLLGVAVYELQQHGLRLKRPSLPVVASFAFGIYQLARIAIFYKEPRAIKFYDVLIVAIWPALWLWYIQSKNIRLRMEAVAWACTVSVVQMLGFWFFVQFIIPTSIFPLPSLLGLLTGTGTPLSPYRSQSGNVGGLCRCQLFFLFPTFFALVTGFLGLVALEIKNRLWSRLLFLGSVFLMFLSATRVVWVAFPIVLGLRYLFSIFGKRWGAAVIFALIAVASFFVFSLPVFTDLLLNKFTYLTEIISKFREGSTNTRLEIYRQTWESIPDNLLWGHLALGPPISPYALDYELVGTHSVILGNLLYFNGLVGTGIFLVFWISLLIWFYKTREERPLICFCMWFFYTFISITMDTAYGMPISSLPILLCAAIRSPKLKPVQNKIVFKKLHHA